VPIIKRGAFIKSKILVTFEFVDPETCKYDSTASTSIPAAIKNIPMAIEYVKKALNLIPEFLEASFELSKYLSVNDQNEEAASTLESVILKDRLYSRKAVLDNDLLSNNLIIKLLEKLKTDAVSKAKSEFNECKTIVLFSLTNFLSGNSILNSNRPIGNDPFWYFVQKVPRYSRYSTFSVLTLSNDSSYKRIFGSDDNIL